MIILLQQAIEALSTRQYCQECWDSVVWHLNPLVTPKKPLLFGLEFFPDTFEAKSLLEILLRSIQDTRFFLEECVYLYQQSINDFFQGVKDLNDHFMNIFIELRYGVYYYLVPPLNLWGSQTPYGLERKIQTLQRVFRPPIGTLHFKMF